MISFIHYFSKFLILQNSRTIFNPLVYYLIPVTTAGNSAIYYVFYIPLYPMTFPFIMQLIECYDASLKLSAQCMLQTKFDYIKAYTATYYLLGARQDIDYKMTARPVGYSPKQSRQVQLLRKINTLSFYFFI